MKKRKRNTFLAETQSSNDIDASNPESSIYSCNHENIYIHSATLSCAVDSKCIPCYYKIYPTGTVGLPRNQRPESCPRSRLAVFNGIYDKYVVNSNILTVGDGDFSFSLSVANGLKRKATLVATSHESRHIIESTYPSGLSNVDKLRQLNALVYHDVDATSLTSTLELNPYLGSFRAIIWNFPCIRMENGADAQLTEVEANQNLLRKFFQNCRPYLTSKVIINTTGTEEIQYTGEVHFTHKTIEPFSWWGIIGIAEENGFEHVCSLVFDRYLYPGYINRKVLDKKSFPIHDAKTYIFIPKTITTSYQKVEILQALSQQYDYIDLQRKDIQERIVTAIKSLR